MHAYLANIRGMTRSNWSFVYGWSVISLAQFGFSAVLLNLYLVQLGFNKPQIGGILAIGSLVMALASLPAGFLGARFGPRAMFQAGFLTVLAGWVLMLLVPSLPNDSLYASLSAGQGVIAIGQAMILVNGMPYFMQITTSSNRIFLASFQQFVQGCAGIIGAMLAGVLPGILLNGSGGALGEAGSFRASLVLVLLLYISAYLVLRSAPAISVPATQRAADSSAAAPARLLWRVFAYFGLVVILMAAGMGGISSFFNLYLYDLGFPTAVIGSLMSISQIMPFFAALTVPALNQRLKIGTLFGLAALLMAVNAVLLSSSSLLVIIIIGLAFQGYFTAAFNTVRSLYGQQLVDPRWRTYISAVNAIGMAVGFGLASSAGGVISGTVGFPVLFRVSAVILLACGTVTLAFERMAARQAGRTAPAVPPS
jgi:MFS family permease